MAPRLGPDDKPVEDVLIVGGGQSGVIAAAALRREGLERVTVVDQACAGREGPWSTFARMAELRTPKTQVGSELSLPSLSVRRWFEATHGEGSWDTIERIPTHDWQAYLAWYRDTTGVDVVNEVSVCGIREATAGVLAVDTIEDGAPCTRWARSVVLTTGFDGAGAWRVPTFVSDRLDPSFYDHSNTVIGFDALRGKRIGVLGHGASAFDNANAAIDAGAASVDICFRRDRLPRTNPHRQIETAGLMTHYPELSDEVRWNIAQFFRSNDQPPPQRSFSQAMASNSVTLRPATPWLDLEQADGVVRVSTPDGVLEFDHLILATGAVTDLATRPELTHLEPLVRRWSDAIEISADDHDPRLGALPYLDTGYAFEPRDDGDDWVRRVFAFNSLSFVSQGPHSTSISGHRHALPRLIRGITRRLFLDGADSVIDDLVAYESRDLDVPDDFEQRCRHESRLSTAPGQERERAS
ncbi:MAG: FAD/NAD(P)-binding protein [Ilumatobacter sp.]